MFILEIEEGLYYTAKPFQTPLNKRHYSYWASWTHSDYAERQLKSFREKHLTKDLNKAFLFEKLASLRASNAYSWGGTVHEVETTTIIKKVTK